MKENKNIEFLNTIYQITEMGVIGIDDVFSKVSKADFREFLEEQNKEYNTILEESEKVLSSYGAKEKELGKMVKMNSKMMADMKLLTNKDDKVIAKMMVEGSTKGIIKIKEAMNTYNDEDGEVTKLGEKLLKTLENNIEGLKIYL